MSVLSKIRGVVAFPAVLFAFTVPGVLFGAHMPFPWAVAATALYATVLVQVLVGVGTRLIARPEFKLAFVNAVVSAAPPAAREPDEQDDYPRGDE